MSLFIIGILGMLKCYIKTLPPSSISCRTYCSIYHLTLYIVIHAREKMAVYCVSLLTNWVSKHANEMFSSFNLPLQCNLVFCGTHNWNLNFKILSAFYFSSPKDALFGPNVFVWRFHRMACCMLTNEANIQWIAVFDHVQDRYDFYNNVMFPLSVAFRKKHSSKCNFYKSLFYYLI